MISGVLGIGSSALRSYFTLLDVTANNLANANTTGFRNSRVNFQEVGGFGGVQVGTIDSSNDSGGTVQTGRRLDFAINGNGYFQIGLPNGQLAFTRDGNFHVNGSGQLVTSNGYLVQPEINIPADAVSVSVNSTGAVSVRTANNPTDQLVGNLTIADFANPGGLQSLGQNLFSATAASGPPLTGSPGAGALGDIQQGALEGSNTDLISGLVGLLVAKHGVSLSTQIIRSGNEMLAETVNLLA